MDVLIKAKERFKQIISESDLIEDEIIVSARGLTPKEAIGNPSRDDFPLMSGREVMIEAKFREALGQSFTDQPSNYTGKLKDILNLDLQQTAQRAIFVATLNAVLRFLNLATKTVHCKNDEPELCAIEIVNWIRENYPQSRKVGIIGFQPAIVENLSKLYGANRVVVADLDPNKIGKTKFGIRIYDGHRDNERLIKEVDFVLITGSSLVNNTLNQLLAYVEHYQKEYRLFGNTISGVATLLNLPHLCYYGR